MLENYGDILSVSDICNILNISTTTAYRYLNSGLLPNKRIGRRFYILKKSIIKYLSDN